jgi:mRNA interferase MazF
VVVSSAEYNKTRPDVILMAVTGQLSGYARTGEVVVSDWRAAGLLKASTIKPILTTIEKTLIIRALGEMGSQDILALKDVLRMILG